MKTKSEGSKEKAIKRQIFCGVIELLEEAGLLTGEESNRMKDMIDWKEA